MWCEPEGKEFTGALNPLVQGANELERRLFDFYKVQFEAKQRSEKGRIYPWVKEFWAKGLSVPIEHTGVQVYYVLKGNGTQGFPSFHGCAMEFDHR